MNSCGATMSSFIPAGAQRRKISSVACVSVSCQDHAYEDNLIGGYTVVAQASGKISMEELYEQVRAAYIVVVFIS